MRVTCPNCGAEYEVPEALVPPAGKHVQCTACHTRWFLRGLAREELSEEEILRKLESRNAPRPKPTLVAGAGLAAGGVTVPFPAPSQPSLPPAAEAGVPEERSPAEKEPAAQPDETPPAGMVLAGITPAATASNGPAPGGGAPGGVEETGRGIGLPLAPARMPGGSVREMPANEAGLPAARSQDRAAPEPARMMAERASGEREAEPPPPDAPTMKSRLETKPRLELPSAEEAAPAPVARRGRGRFWPGLLLALLLAGLAMEIYLWRAPLAEQVPIGGAALESYAAAVDAAREWVRDRIGGAE